MLHLQDLEQEEVERRFKEHHLALVAEAKSLQAFSGKHTGELFPESLKVCGANRKGCLPEAVEALLAFHWGR